MTVLSGAPEALQKGQEAVRPLLRKALSRLDGDCGSVAAYHLGFTDLDGTPAESTGGKAVRPALAILSARAAGAEADTGLPGAVAVELVHNFSLVHDDLMDGDKLRRHRPTVWSVWGSATAILVGDALLSLAHEMLLEETTQATARAAALLSEATRKLIRGQVADLAFEHRDDVTVAECLRMCADKTGALLSASTAIGAVLAGAPKATVDALAEFGMQLGLAFQMVDDLLGIWGDPAATGKPVYSDLRSRKKSLPVCYAANSASPAGRSLARWLTSHDGESAGRSAARWPATGGESAGRSAARWPMGEGEDESELERVAALVSEAGGRDWAEAEARQHIEAAHRALGAAPMDSEVRAELIDIANFIVDREM